MTYKEWLLASIVAATIATVYIFFDAVPQYPSYFRLSDSRSFLGIPNALNVLSNLPYLVVGALGMVEIGRWGKDGGPTAHSMFYRVVFFGFAMTAFGSAYFHWAPARDTLVWDRLPMTILFMGFFASVIAELISPKAARRLLPALLVIGMASVLHWAWTESGGRGDLRAYGLVQFLPIVLILAMLGLYRRPPAYAETVAYLIFCYAAAKIFEHFDQEIHAALVVVSGHSLKHLISGISGVFLLLWLRQRRRFRDTQADSACVQPGA